MRENDGFLWQHRLNQFVVPVLRKWFEREHLQATSMESGAGDKLKSNGIRRPQGEGGKPGWRPNQLYCVPWNQPVRLTHRRHGGSSHAAQKGAMARRS